LPAKTGKRGATESSINYQAFQYYIGLPASERSLRRVAHDLNKNEKLIERWSSKFEWIKRALAWDQHQDFRFPPHSLHRIFPLVAQSWLRQRGESARAYHAARIYFALRAERSLAAVARKELKSVTLMKDWSARDGWVDRAQSFDLYMDTAEIEAVRLQAVEQATLRVKRQQQMRELQYEAAQRMLAKSRAMLDFPLATISKVATKTGEVTIVTPTGWSMGSVAPMLERAFRLATEAIRNE
jgi:hypothetical protein